MGRSKKKTKILRSTGWDKKRKTQSWRPSSSMLRDAGWDVETVAGRLVVFGWRTPNSHPYKGADGRPFNYYEKGKVYVSKSGINYNPNVGCGKGLHMWRSKKNNSTATLRVAALVSETCFPHGWKDRGSHAKCRSVHLFVGKSKEHLFRMIEEYMKPSGPIPM